MSDQAASALGNISAWAWALYAIAGVLAAGVLAVALWTLGGVARDVAVIAVQLGRGVIRRQRLVAAISKAGGVQRATRAMDLGDLVIHRETERYAAHKAAAPTEVIDPDPALGCPCCPGARSNDCTCAIPCGDPSCQALDPPDGECEWCELPALLAPAPCACPGDCGAPWCAKGRARRWPT